jgi:hypothetical protein
MLYKPQVQATIGECCLGDAGEGSPTWRWSWNLSSCYSRPAAMKVVVSAGKQA